MKSHLVRVFASTILVASLAASPTGARPVLEKKEAPLLTPLNDRPEHPAVEFVAGNVRFVLYHELAHAVIHIFNIPVLGGEEQTADTLAALSSLPTNIDSDGDRLNGRMTIAVTSAFLLKNEIERKAGLKPVYWDSHGLDMQRAYRILCLIYGSHPEHYTYMAEAAQLSAGHRARCVEEYRQAARGWGEMLGKMHRKEGQTPHHFVMRYEPANPRSEELEREAKIIPILLGRTDEFFALPEDLPIEVKSCGEANAFYSPAQRKMTVCYELLDFFNKLALYGMQN